MSVQTESIVNLDLTPTPACQLGFVIEMARSHVDDVDTGIEDGTYDASDNEDIEEKRLALDAIYAHQGRLIACLDVCDGVDTMPLVDLGKGAMNRLRDRAYQDRKLYLDMREMLISVVHEVSISEACELQRFTGHANKLKIKLDEGERLLNATREDIKTGEPAGRLVRFVNQVAALKIWGCNAEDGSPYKECIAPTEGFLDSHCCLMELVQEARRLTTQP